MNYKKPTVNCCDYSKAYIIATFKFTEKDYENENIFKEAIPKWIIRGSTIDDLSTSIYRNNIIKYCPGCGKKLPKLKLKSKLEGNFTTTDCNGYYCMTCNERSHSCTCIDPIKMWEVVE